MDNKNTYITVEAVTFSLGVIFLYSGIAYHVKQGRKGLFSVESDIKLIEGNIIQILGTRRGERVMLPLFGSKMLDFIHEPLEHITLCAPEILNSLTQ